MSCMAFDEPKRCLYTGGEDGLIKLWNFSSGQQLRSYTMRRPRRVERKNREPGGGEGKRRGREEEGAWDGGSAIVGWRCSCSTPAFSGQKEQGTHTHICYNASSTLALLRYQLAAFQA